MLFGSLLCYHLRSYAYHKYYSSRTSHCKTYMKAHLGFEFVALKLSFKATNGHI